MGFITIITPITGICLEKHSLQLQAAASHLRPVTIAEIPSVGTVNSWSSEDFVAALNHDAACSQYNLQFRQFIHVSFKVAAAMGPRYSDALKEHRGIVGRRVRENLLKKHIEPLFC